MSKLLTRPRFRWSIASALTLSMVLVIVLLMGLVTFMDIRRERAISRDALQQRSLLLANGLNDVLANYLYFTQMDALRDVAKVVGSQPDITYVRISTPDGRLLVTEPRGDDQSDYPTGYVQDEFASNALLGGQAVLKFDGDSLEVASPILSGTEAIGVFQFGFNVDALNAEIREIILQHIWQGLALVAMGVVLAYLIARYASRYIGDLATVAGEMGRGDLDVLVPSKGPREVIDLAGALERMREELRAPYIGLEQRVAERTEELSRTTEELKAQIAERQRAEAAERQLVEEMAVVDQVARILTSTLDIQQVYEEFVSGLRTLVPFDRMTINVINEDAKDFTFKYLAGPALPGWEGSDVVPMDGTQTQHVLTTGQSLIIPDISRKPMFRLTERFLQVGLRSSISVSLMHQGRLLGTLNLRSNRIGAYTVRHQTILERLASQIAPAVGNAKLFQKVEQLALAIANIGDGVCVTDPEGRIQFVNGAMEQILGYHPGELVGTPSRICIQEDLTTLCSRRS